MESAFGIEHGEIARTTVSKYSAAYGTNRYAVEELKQKKLAQIDMLKKDKLKKLKQKKPELSVVKQKII